jgi:Large polyvalent protein associated domain 29
MTVAMQINEELNGIELFFDGKPSEEVRSNLKSNGFRWSGYKKCWYSKQSETAHKIALSLVEGKEVETVTSELGAVKKQSKTAKKEALSLWNATRWTDIEVNTDQDAKIIAKEIRSHIKKRFPQCRFSVRVPYYGRISFDIKSSPYEKGSTYLNEILGYCKNLLDAYKHCYSPSDPYTDYAGSYNFTGWAEISWEYTQTEATEQDKKDMKEFEVKLSEWEAAEEERKAQEYQQWELEREIQANEYKKQEEERKQQKESILNSVTVNELEEDNQYYIIGSEFANLNKNNTLDDYKEEVLKGKYSLEDVKITKEIHFNDQESLTNFSNMLLQDFDFLAGTGGSFTEDNRLNSMTDFHNMEDEERQTVKWYLKGVAIYFNNELQFIVDAQGQDYARYVGLTDNAKVEKTITVDQVKDSEEIEELKHQAGTLEDISVSVIDELNIVKTWKNENWNEYKNSLKGKLNQCNFKLTKEIIQQLEIEDLKTAMYKVLIEVDGIQDQFEKADIQEGEKVTLFYVSDWGSIVTHRITFNSAVNSSYAQYDNAVKLTFTPEKKRKLHYKYFYSTLLVFKGWHNLPENVLHHVEETNGMRITRSKYHSCDHKQYDEILNYFNDQGVRPVVNTYKPQF